jgi:hypothetical protein
MWCLPHVLDHLDLGLDSILGGIGVVFTKVGSVTTPLLEECEDDTHIPKMGTWESFRTLETLEFDCRGQNTST